MAIYEKGVDLFPDNEKLQNNLGIACLDIDEQESERYFLSALDINPDYEVARKNLALLYNKQSRFSESSDQFLVLVKKFPENINYNYDLAINRAQKFYEETRSEQDLDDALNYFYRVQELSPGFQKTSENIKVLEEIKSLINSR